MGDLALVAALFTPLFAGLVLHGLCIKLGWLSWLAQPIDRGLLFRGRRLLGASKTWRGILAVALGAGAGYALAGTWPALVPPPLRQLPAAGLFLFGCLLGSAAMLSELPNSFAKRQLGISPGAPGRGLAAPLFYLLDQVDFLVGAWLAAAPWIEPTALRIAWSVLFVLVVHPLITALGFLLGMRATVR